MQTARPQPRRVSRRWFLRSAGGAVAVAATTAAGCIGSSSKPKTAAIATATTAGNNATTTSPTRLATTSTAQDSRRGGTLRFTGLIEGDGIYDPHKSQSESFLAHQSLVYSRLLSFKDQARGEIVPDLARTMPEQPDATTLIFEINGNAHWQDVPPYNGRPITAEDVKLSIERQTGSDPGFAHRARWSRLDKIEVDGSRLTIRLKEPYAPIFGLLADASAYIVPAEVSNGSVVPTRSLQPGSGPFRWVEWSERKLASVARNPGWYGGTDRPLLDGVATVFASDATEIEARLRTKELDVAVVGRPAADRLTKAIPGLQEQVAGHAQWFGMLFYLPIAPYNDNRLRTAISIAVDRREMLQKFFAGSGELNPWISWPLTRWSLPQAELLNIPGHRARAVERQADVAEANRLLAASLAERPLPGELELLVPEDIERSLGMGSLIKAQIKKNLDLNVSVNALPIGTVVQRLRDGKAPWAVGQDSGWLDLDDWVYPYFHSDGPKNSFPLRDANMDSMISAQRQELDETKRREIGYAIQRKLLNLNAGVNLVSERVVTLAWPYVKSFPVDIGSGYQNRFADAWLDRNDPTFRGR